MMARIIPEPGQRAEWLSDPELRQALERFVRRKLPRDEALDVVQSTVADALASDGAPDDREGFRRFVFVIARNKLADHFRRAGRETPDQDAADFEPASHDPISARDLLRWAEQELPNSEDKSTLEWMLREADGDKLEHIAEEAQVPAPRVRQRVSRLRRYLRSRWAAQLAAAGVTGLCLWLGYAYVTRDVGPGPITEEKPRPLDHARKLRELAFERCTARDFRGCLERFDQAKELDPKGDELPDVQSARRAAAEALRPPPAPSSEAPVAPVPVPPVPSSSAPRAVPKSAPTPRPTDVAPKPQPPVQQKAVPSKGSKGGSLDFDSNIDFDSAKK